MMKFGGANKNGSIGYMYFYSAATVACVSFSTAPGRIWYMDGTNSIVISSAKDETWYHVKIDVDPENYTMDVSINGEKVLSDGNFRNKDTISRIRFGISNNAPDTTMTIDNVRVIAGNEEIYSTKPGWEN
jgi:hypothetical protein